MKTSYNLRSIAAKAINQVLDQGLSLSTVIPELQKKCFRQRQSITTGTLLWCITYIATIRMDYSATHG